MKRFLLHLSAAAMFIACTTSVGYCQDDTPTESPTKIETQEPQLEVVILRSMKSIEVPSIDFVITANPISEVKEICHVDVVALNEPTMFTCKQKLRPLGSKYIPGATMPLNSWYAKINAPPNKC